MSDSSITSFLMIHNIREGSSLLYGSYLIIEDFDKIYQYFIWEDSQGSSKWYARIVGGTTYEYSSKEEALLHCQRSIERRNKSNE